MKALLLLYWLQAKASVRRLTSGLKTLKGKFVFVFFLVLFGVGILPNLFLALTMEEKPIQNIEIYMPFGMLAYFLFSALSSIGSRAIYFTPSEVDNLFPAPFTRRQLLLYKVISWAVVAVFMAFFFTIAFAMNLGNLFYGFVGFALGLFFLTVCDMTITLVGQIFSEQIYSTARKIFVLVCLSLLAFGMFQALNTAEVSDLQNITQWFQRVAESPVTKIVLAPFIAVTNVVFAESVAGFLGWSLAVSGMIGGLVAFLLMLDANYIESAAKISEEVFEKFQRMKQGKLKVSEKSVGWKLSMFPRMQGFGPMAWLQIVSMIRQSKVLMYLTLGLSVAMIGATTLDFDKSITGGPHAVAIAFGMMAYLTAIFSVSLPLGFRNDVDHIEVFKSLPVRPFCIAAGELVGAVSLFSCAHFILTFAGVVATRDFFPWWLTGLAFIIPFNIMMVTLSNFLFLKFPVRNLNGAKDIQTVAQGILFMFLQGVTVLTVAVIVVVPALLVYWLAHSIPLAWGLAWVMLSLCAMVGVFATGAAYQKFDVAKIPA